MLMIALLISSLFFSVYSQSKTKIELKDNWYYLNGQKFFIKAIGYEIGGSRPGQHPYEGKRNDDLDLMKFDLKVMRRIDNTIRTWSEFSEAQLKLVQESGLKLILGLEIDPEGNYADPSFVDKVSKG